MNSKASVSKELNARHTKILEGLLKLQENRECADCHSKISDFQFIYLRAPRWASVNLGIFICMQCSGTHRGLGVHISQVRSTTLDTWLPEQVAFMQSVGNRRSNSFWEAELPPNFDRSGIDRFIHAKYGEKRWVSRNSKQPTQVLSRMNYNDMLVEGAASRVVPRQTRPQSLDEESFSRITAQLSPPITRPRWASLDMKSDPMAFPTSKGLTESIKRTDGPTDLYSLLYVDDTQQNTSSMETPSSWATFDCKYMVYLLRNDVLFKQMELATSQLVKSDHGIIKV
ncbi:hypothetical protein POTOM_041762 [Populus tomentosa]|uniref:Arf-GAP domain-containing protein n=1 Tax=Populus tomentosa TaxID=118781 RepID=A0A8X7YME9_POPTO|nr:hypothetical protein POTOM_041762 [Populus tomentosa]